MKKKVWPGEEGSQKVYAMKIMNKEFMIAKNQVRRGDLLSFFEKYPSMKANMTEIV